MFACRGKDRQQYGGLSSGNEPSETEPVQQSTGMQREAKTVQQKPIGPADPVG